MSQASDGRKPTVSGRVPQDVYDRLEEYCEDRDVSKTDVLRRALEQYLARQNRNDMVRAFESRANTSVWHWLTTTLLLLVTIRVYGLV